MTNDFNNFILTLVQISDSPNLLFLPSPTPQCIMDASSVMVVNPFTLHTLLNMEVVSLLFLPSYNVSVANNEKTETKRKKRKKEINNNVPRVYLHYSPLYPTGSSVY
jgi:hypothetical protein